MALIEFKNLPDTSTPLSAENLNNNFVYCVPTGGIVEFAGAEAPNGWLLCDGAAISRTEYANLFSVIGTAFGEGDGSTTFNLPNRKNRTGVGVDSDSSHFATLGATYGEETHTLTVDEIPPHTHKQNYNDQAKCAAGTAWLGTTTGQNTTTSSTGGGKAHNNIQPSIAMNYIIKF